MAVPTRAPAVPGAFGANPAPPAVAMTIAIHSVAPAGSLFVFTIPIGSVNFFSMPFFGGNAVFSAGPFAEVDQLTSLTAKRAIRIDRVFNFFSASWTLHWRRSFQ